MSRGGNERTMGDKIDLTMAIDCIVHTRSIYATCSSFTAMSQRDFNAAAPGTATPRADVYICLRGAPLVFAIVVKSSDLQDRSRIKLD